ncbi:MAG TPA: class I SAM-dependent methyltransferase [Elusimicrobiales bacterium]|nr:class I SAM-dependent methyltransferase [Elusimicrobiales bacterium]
MKGKKRLAGLKKPVGDVYWDGLHYDAFNTPYQDDQAFYLAQARKAGGPVLELACGTGRLTLPLRKAGIDITGLDQAEPMLERARAKAAAAGLNVNFIKGDARRFRLGRLFSLIFIPFNSLQHMLSRTDIEGLFACVSAHLAPGGRFIFDVFNPDPHYLIRDTKELLPVAYYPDPAGGGQVLVNEQYSYDRAVQVSRIRWHYRREKDGKTVTKRLNLRCFYPAELEALVHYNGFKIVSRLGGFDGRPFTGTCAKQVLILKKRS